jgi:hypothetical protein
MRDKTHEEKQPMKKWFVFIQDHHEGPFTVEEIKNLVAQGKVSSDGFVWAEGMADWTSMRNLQEFQSAGAPLPSPSYSSDRTIEFRAPQTTSTSVGVGGGMQPKFSQPSSPGVLIGGAVSQAKDELNRKKRLWLLWVLAAGVVVAAWSQGYLSLDPLLNPMKGILRSIPGLSALLNPIPELKDVTPEELEKMRQIAQADSSTPQGALVLIQDDLINPRLYLVTNLPENMSWLIEVEGVPETLLNQLNFVRNLTVIQEKQLAVIGPIRYEDGRILPRGEYRIRVKADPSQLAQWAEKFPNLGTFQLEGKFFLGGPKDPTYTQRLKDFHDKLREKAQQEVIEIRQFSQMLETQVAEIEKIYEDYVTFAAQPKMTAKTTPKGVLIQLKAQAQNKLKSWSEALVRWKKIDEQIQGTFSKFTPQILTEEYFYGPLYQGLSETHKVSMAILQDRLKEIQTPKPMADFTARQSQVVASLKKIQEELQKIEERLKNPEALPEKVSSFTLAPQVAPVAEASQAPPTNGGSQP